MAQGLAQVDGVTVATPLKRDPLGGATNWETRMFFARVRWVGRVLDGAGIDTNSKIGRELSTTLIKFSKYCQEKNRRGEGARGVRLDLSAAEWALLGAILAPAELRVADHVAEALGLSHSDAVALVTRTRESALELAEREMPGLLPAMTSE